MTFTGNSPQDRIRLHNGVEIPCIGYGTYKVAQEEACRLVKEAASARVPTILIFNVSDSCMTGILHN